MSRQPSWRRSTCVSHFRKTSRKDAATITTETLAWFDQEWSVVDIRIDLPMLVAAH